ncbi:PadR family transcriptional regulator [Myxacorys almedinensis]|uniref:PadR family transcriptional regulator n=1 Tax=Myxacorys almedinensis A TaxID=2690445 RepID=A0A8J7Z0U7_9CYAN|nr:PadR family transcriptional regulator [Myxacorys almedinensis]NDJ18207.1 PadR family transcriptional regulator [Myxacorys almedinensis A]
MSLSHAILALILDTPCSGYDLAKDFDRAVNFFWSASHQQIYRELAKLEEQGWVQVEAIAQLNRPGKKLYSITEAGKAHLAKWLTQPSDVMPIKEELLVKLWAGHLLEPAILSEEVKRHRQFHADKLDGFMDIEQQFYSSPADLSLQATYQYLVLRRGIRYERDRIAWCDEVLELMMNHPDVKSF